MSKVNGQSVAGQEKSLWAGPTQACGLWLAVHGACLRAGPSLFFYFCLRAGGIQPALKISNVDHKKYF